MSSSTAAPSLGKVEILTIFKDKMLMFLDSLIEMFPERPELIVMRMIFSDQLSIEDFVRKFTINVLPYKNTIFKRDEEFFLSDDNPIFTSYASAQAGLLQSLWKSQSLDDEDRKSIWEWMDLFVRLSEMYSYYMK